jgi:Ca-activated chloride channel family protein
MPQFEWPGVLLALLALPFLGRIGRRGAPAALRITRPVDPALMPHSTRQRWVGLPGALRIAALALLICALAGPRATGRRVRDLSKTIGIQMVVDCSGSMNEADMMFEGQRRSRIDLVRELSKDFVLGNGIDLKGRMEDTIGVIAFADYPVTLCPLMLPDRGMRKILEDIKVGPNADGTAIGDALVSAAARFHHAEAVASERFRSKVIVLLTDGENNSGKHTVSEAGLLARQWGVRIYAIAIRPGEHPQQIRRAGGPMEALEWLAEQTGGVARMVTNGHSLQAVYSEIDRLERGDQQSSRFTVGWTWIYGLAGAGLSLLVIEIVLAQTWLRRIP